MSSSTPIYCGLWLEAIYEKKHLRLRPQDGQPIGTALRVRCSRKFRAGLSIGQRIRLDVKLIEPIKIKPYLVALKQQHIYQLTLF
jgi:hypothetical protein